MNNDKKGIIAFGIVGIMVFTIILIYHYLLTFELIVIKNEILRDLIYQTLYKINQRNNIYIVRGAIPILGIAISFYQRYSEKGIKNKIALYAMFPLLPIYFYGYGTNEVYGLYIYPIGFLLTFIGFPMAVANFINPVKETEKPIGINRKHDKDSLPVETDKEGILWVVNPNAGVWVEGGAGSGKTYSTIVPSIVEFVKQGRAGVLYDLEGDLTQKDGATLTRVVYTALHKSKSDVKFAFINMTDLARTVKVNPISPKYIKSYTHALEISNAIMLNLNKEWSQPSQRFWAENGINAFAGTIWHFVTKKPDMATIPHVVEFLTRDFKNSMLILAQDKEVLPYIRPVLAPFLKQNAGGQAAGAESTTQFSMAKLRTKECYYVLSPTEDEEMGLDITNEENPIILCLGSNKPMEMSTIPILGSIMQVCRMNMNQGGKRKSFFMVDELPTIYIDKLERLPAEARKHGVSTFLALQTFAQLEESYGREKARIIQDNCANLFIGKTSVESADKIVRMMGEYEKNDQSYSYTDSSNTTSVRKQFDKLVRINDITGQSPGHFTGAIGGGKPSFFSTQLKGLDYETIDIPAFNPELMRNGVELTEQEKNEIVNNKFESITEDIDLYISSYMESAEK